MNILHPDLHLKVAKFAVKFNVFVDYMLNVDNVISMISVVNPNQANQVVEPEHVAKPNYKINPDMISQLNQPNQPNQSKYLQPIVTKINWDHL